MTAIAANIQRLHRTGEHEQMFEFIKTQNKETVLDELIKWGMSQEFRSVVMYGFRAVQTDSWTYENEQSFIYQDHEYQYEITIRNCDIVSIGYFPM